MFRYADKMFSLSYEMLDIVNYRKESQVLFDVGIADALSKRLASRVLLSVIPNDGSIHLRCFESTHELLLEQLSEHKLDMILSDCPVDSSQHAGLLSKRLGAVASASSARRRCPKNPFPPVWRAQAAHSRSPYRHGSPVDPMVRATGHLSQHPGEFDDAA